MNGVTVLLFVLAVLVIAVGWAIETLEDERANHTEEG